MNAPLINARQSQSADAPEDGLGALEAGPRTEDDAAMNFQHAANGDGSPVSNHDPDRCASTDM